MLSEFCLWEHSHPEEMQTNKSRRASEPPHKISLATTRPNSLNKASGADDSITCFNQPRKISSYRSQKENDQQTLSRNSLQEKRRPRLFTQLESQLGELQEELKRTKDQLASTESCRNGAQQEAQEAKMQLLMMSSKFEDSQRQLVELSEAEDIRIHELRKISQERDKAWQSELAALQSQQSIDMATWSSAMRETQKLRYEIELLVKSESSMAKQLDSANSELLAVKEEIRGKNFVIDRLNIQISENKVSKVMPNGSSNEAELQQNSKVRINELEDMVKKLQVDKNAAFQSSFGQKDQPNSANDLINNVEIVSSQSESKLELELKDAKAEIAELKSKLVNKDADLKCILDMNKKLNDEIRAQVNQVETEFSSKITQAAIDITELKTKLADKNSAFQKLSEENTLLKTEMEKCDKSSEAEIEAELKRVTLHSHQWRKAAETAAAILMAGSNGRIIERTGSLDPQCFFDERNLMQASNLDEISCELPKSKNHNVLAMIGGLWKKS